MSVDRSYSPYEVIRAYHDRGMMKWGAFATGELTEAQNTFEKEKKEDKVIQTLPHHLVLHLLNQSFSNQLQIKVKYQSKNKLNEVYGFVSEFINNQDFSAAKNFIEEHKNDFGEHFNKAKSMIENNEDINNTIDKVKDFFNK